MAQKIINRISARMTVAGKKVEVGCSMGIAHSTAGAGMLESAALMQQADAAMYAAKAAGGNGYQIATTAMQTQMHSSKRA